MKKLYIPYLASQICQVPAKGKGPKTLTKQSGSSNPVMMERRWQRFEKSNLFFQDSRQKLFFRRNLRT